MIHVEPKHISVLDIQKYLLGGVGPRPIALVSTLSANGLPNLSPFSFYNVFGANPPTIAFSAARRIRDKSTKDTYNNLVATKECVVQSVTHSMVQQVSLASTEYDSNTDEFIKSGLTKEKSDIVKPFRVKQSPFQMECKLKQMIPLGDDKGSGNLAICEIVKFHIAKDLFVNEQIDPKRMDLVARLGGNWYCRADSQSLFEIEKPIANHGIGYDNLPDFILNSDILTANNLAQLANVEKLPDKEEAIEAINKLSPVEASEESFYRASRSDDDMAMLVSAVSLCRKQHPRATELLECSAKHLLNKGKTELAWHALLFADSLANTL